MSRFGKAISSLTETQMVLILFPAAHWRACLFHLYTQLAGMRLSQTFGARLTLNLLCFAFLLPSMGTPIFLECFLQHCFYLVAVDSVRLHTIPLDKLLQFSLLSLSIYSKWLTLERNIWPICHHTKAELATCPLRVFKQLPKQVPWPFLCLLEFYQ